MDKQLSLFDELPDPWRSDDNRQQPIATVILVDGPDRPLDYLVPDELLEQLQPGCRVVVPLGRGNRSATGYCVDVAVRTFSGDPSRLKAIRSIVDEKSLLSPKMLELTRWIAKRYLCRWSAVLDTALPAGVRGKAGTRLTTLLSINTDLSKETIQSHKLTEKQKAVLDALRKAGRPLTPSDLATAAGCTQSPITTLRRKGILSSEISRVQTKTVTQDAAPKIESHLELNTDQRSALDAILDSIASPDHQTILLHGVTSSGKTEVYIQAIDEVIKQGRQAIVLVPEISLTPQTVRRFRSRFGDVAVLHSHMTAAERHWHWQQIAEGRVSVVVGARSAIFAPTPQLGLIIMDEEHESTFKQDESPRYHARNVAIERAKQDDIPLVLGSATPSLESWHHARSGKYRLVSMPSRVGNLPMPAVDIIDLRCDTFRRRTRGAISQRLHAAMNVALKDEEGQIILLLNRRGYSTHVQCPSCGKVWQCPECDIALTHHLQRQSVICHYCEYELPEPSECDECQFQGLRFSGFGTEKLEAEVRSRFPGVACLRMDTDTMRGKGAHQAALARFRSGEIRILLGTQMIAKGLDFPNVTLVGVINADTALHLPDFRASERTFHLVTQVAGRTGRGEKGGHVLVQTLSPEHPAIDAARRHDFVGFADGELPLRQMLGYPPFAAMIRLVIRGPEPNAVLDFAQLLTNKVRELAVADRPETDVKTDAPPTDLLSGPPGDDSDAPPPGILSGGILGGGILGGESQADDGGVRILGPAPAPFARRHGKFRFHVQLQSADGDRLRNIVRQAGEALRTPKDVEWIADVDPINML